MLAVYGEKQSSHEQRIATQALGCLDTLMRTSGDRFTACIGLILDAIRMIIKDFSLFEI